MKKLAILLAACMMVIVGFGSTSATDCSVCGDLTGDGNVDISDLAAYVDWFYSLETPNSPASADIDGKCYGGRLSDLDYMVAYLFEGGPAPDCGCN